MNETLFELPDPQETKPETGVGKPRLKLANRQQIEWRPVDLDSQIAQDHPVRLIWEMVAAQDLKLFYDPIKAVEGHAGQSAIDPRILLAVWAFATIEGVGSARALERLCREHDAYRWLCGGVSVNYHTLADFRVGKGAEMDKLLIHTVAALDAEGLVEIKRVAHDGKKIRASAGSASFRRRKTLEKHLAAAQEQVESLRRELEDNPGATSARQKAARERAARERQQRVEKALQRLEELEVRQKQRGTKQNQKQRQQEPRASTTDAEAHRMKMADGGTRPAYNVQISTDVEARVILAVEVTNQGNDNGLLLPSVEQIDENYHRLPEEMLVDGGFVNLKDITVVTQKKVTVYAPVPTPRKEGVDPHQPKPDDTSEVAAWRVRMATDEAKKIYPQRASTAEWANAWLDNWGLDRLVVRGIEKAKAVATLFAVVFNLLQGHKLRVATAKRGSLAA